MGLSPSSLTVSKQLLASCAFLFVLAGLARGDDSWPTFRGPQRTATAPDKGLLTEWPAGGPKLVWKTTGAGRGYASLAIVDGRIYTLGDEPSTAQDKDEYLVCYNQADGKQLWQTKAGESWTEGKPDWQNARSTPTIDGDRLYVITPHGALICSTTDGKELWRKDLKKDFDGKKAEMWGYSESATVDGDLLLCTPGGPTNTMVALDKKTGDKRWAAAWPGNRGAAHSSIVITNVGGTRVYVQSTGSGAMGVRATDGKLLWKFDIDQTTAVIPTPVVRDDLVFYVAGYGRGGALLKQVAGGDGDVKMEVVYPLKTELSNKHGGVVLVGDYLYGDTEDKGVLWCAELMTGKVKWKSRGPGSNSASIVVADDHLYVHYADGTMALVKASPESFQAVSHFKVPGSGGDRPSWAHPVILDGKLYVREGDVIACYDIRK